MKKKNLLIGLIVVFIFFVGINVLIFVPVILKESKGNINKEARIYLISAGLVNNFYIIPLSEKFGFLNPMTKPFYMTRNFLYKKGMNKLALNDGEREWWWFRIKEKEFVLLHLETLLKWNPLNVLPKNKADELLRMEDEVYTHLLRIPDVKPYDKTLAKEKYMMFIETAYRYSFYAGILPGKFKNDYNLDYSDREIEHFEKLYNTYLKYKNYTEKQDKESLQFFIEKKKFETREPVFIAQTLYTLLSELYKKNALSCNCKYYEPLAQNQTFISNYLIKNYTHIDIETYNVLVAELYPFYDAQEISKKCRNSDAFIPYQKYLQKREDYYKKANK